MNLKKNLFKYFFLKKWKYLLNFLEENIKNSNIKREEKIDIYLNFFFIIVYLLTEEITDLETESICLYLIKKYYSKSLEIYSEDLEYNFFIGYITEKAPWFFGIDIEDSEKLMKKSFMTDKNNIYIKYYFHLNINRIIPNYEKKIKYSSQEEIFNLKLLLELREKFSKEILYNKKIKKKFKKKGILGLFLFNFLKNDAKLNLGLYKI